VLWVVVIAVLAAAGWFVWTKRAELFEKEEIAAVADPDAGLAAVTSTVPERSLAEGDALLREHASRASKSAELAAWLSAPDIVQRIAAAVRLIAQGRSPRPVLSFLEIEGDFRVIGDRELDPASYKRYDRLTEIFTTVDAAFLGRGYRGMRPYFESAYSQVAQPGERFDGVLIAAIGKLTAVKVPEGRIELVPRGAIYLFKDPALESLSEVEKHLIRMGPRNARAIQDSLRQFASAAELSVP
jgi:hypothetical protein